MGREEGRNLSILPSNSEMFKKKVSNILIVRQNTSTVMYGLPFWKLMNLLCEFLQIGSKAHLRS